MKTKSSAETAACGPQHAYLGHFGKSDALNKGHNTSETVPAQGKKPAITFQKGGEHASLGVPMGQKIPAAKKTAARAGKFGAKAEKQELFRENVLKGRG